MSSRITSYNVCYTKLLRGVGADADFEVLAPPAPFDQQALERHRLVRAGAQRAQRAADRRVDLGTDAGGIRLLAARPLAGISLGSIP